MRPDPITDQSRQDAARAWVVKLARYREPSTWRSLFELAVTLVPFVLLWALAWAALDVSAWLSVAIAVVNGGFLVRIFIIQHDLGHASYFGNRSASDWLGRALGVITLTPYDVWRRTHAIHHAHHGNLSHRGIGLDKIRAIAGNGFAATSALVHIHSMVVGQDKELSELMLDAIKKTQTKK